MSRLSRKYLENRFKRVHDTMEWIRGPVWSKDETGKMVAKVGAVFLQRGPVGGWKVTQITNAGGAEVDLTGFCNTLSATELDAWFSGVLFAKTGER